MEEQRKKESRTLNNTLDFKKVLQDKMVELLEKPMLNEKGKAPLPFLPNEKGFCNTTAVKNAITGHEFKGLSQIVAKTYLHERGQDTDNILTFSQAYNAGTGVKAGERGFTMPFYNQKENKMVLTRYFSTSQVVNKEKLPYISQNQKKAFETVNSSKPSQYLASYLNCIQKGIGFKVKPEIASQFKEEFLKEIKADRKNLLKICNEASKIVYSKTEKHKEKTKEKELTKTKTVEHVTGIDR